MTRLPPDTQTTLMLLNRLGGSEVKPLTMAEYNRLAKALQERGLRPADLLNGVPTGLSSEAPRLAALVSRGTALALSLERWSQAGLNVVGRGEAAYPRRLKGKLRGATAPLIFYCGDLDLLSRQAICVVGSREPTEAGLSFAKSIGEACASQDYAVVSGDARGVDREAMSAALDAGGYSVGVLAEALMTGVLARRNRVPILSGRLLLLSPFDPEARFTVAQAMDRNKYLYALADAAVIVDSDLKGGTWSGAQENLKFGWAPSLVRVGQQARAGNAKLAELGLLPVEQDEALVVGDLVARASAHAVARSAPELPLAPARQTPSSEANTDALELYEMFLARLRRLLAGGPQSEEAVTAHFQLEPNQAERWLSAAEQKHGLERVAGELRWPGRAA